MRKILAAALGTTLAGAGVSPPPPSQPGFGGGEMRAGDDDLPGFLDVAQLSPNQEHQVEDVLRAGAETARTDRLQIRAIRDQIADELAQPNPPSTARMQGLELQVACLEAQLQHDRDQTMVRIREELTADQIQGITRSYRALSDYREDLQRQIGPDLERGD